ncbi:restriction endonuclease subunit S [Tannerella forsythia]|uniref:Restriction endonuclease subunit S n=1 Tax=Tannerella forsythia TaxID=28112 RepID=A0A3P1XPJ6_TANFO|nr:restriction endonuclease subunit S [Tannerella forsythia]RRD59930.1 restriction endonuclease subunit S [Tannerella forsythia]
MKYIENLLKGQKVEWKTLGEVCELQRGKSITSKDLKDGNIPVIAGGQKPAYFHNQHNRKDETIVVAGSGAYAGFVTYWNEPIFVSDAFSIKPNNEDLFCKYVFHFLKDKQDYLYGMKKGGGVPHVYAKDVARILIPIPPLKVQQEIANILDKFTTLEAELEAELEARKKQYEYYRDSLLSFNKMGGASL